MAKSLAGKLLVATPLLQDPNFARTVVFLCAHDEDGAFGVVLNRPVPLLEVEEHLPAWDPYVSPPRVLFSGGPVEHTVAVALARHGRGTLAAVETELPARLSLFDIGQPPEEAAPGVEALRVFSGYAGWGAGQLEKELGEEAWFVVEVDEDDPFTREPDKLWTKVLRRQPGRLAMFAYFPPNPTFN